MKVILGNRIAVLLCERKINSASELGRRMTEAGYVMSPSHASRYLKKTPPKFNIRFLNVACNVLQCMPNELFDIRIEQLKTPDPLVFLPRHANVV